MRGRNKTKTTVISKEVDRKKFFTSIDQLFHIKSATAYEYPAFSVLVSTSSLIKILREPPTASTKIRLSL